MHIEGMACGMCEAHIADTIRKAFPEARKVKVSHNKGTAVFLTKEEADEKKLKTAVEETGYRVLAVASETYKKKGLFG